MITAKTSALIVAVSLIGAMTPAAFGQLSINLGQSNSATQTGTATATGGPGGLGGSGGSATASVSQSTSQGACLLAAGAVDSSIATAAQLANGSINCS